MLYGFIIALVLFVLLILALLVVQFIADGIDYKEIEGDDD